MRNSHNGPYHISWHWHYCEQSNSGASHTHSLVLLRAAAGFLSACVSQWAPPLPGITQHSWTLTTTFQHLLAEYISVSFCSSRPFASSAPGHHLPSLCDMWSPTSLPSTSVTQHPCSSPLSSLFLCFISCPFYFSFPYIYFLFCCFLDIFFLHLTILTFPFSFFYFLLFTLLYLFSSSFSFASFNFFRCYLLFTLLSILYFNLIYFLFFPFLPSALNSDTKNLSWDYCRLFVTCSSHSACWWQTINRVCGTQAALHFYILTSHGLYKL